MKKSYIYSALLVAGMGLASCGSDFLELSPVGAVSQSTLANKENIDKLLSGCYAALYAQEGHNWDMGYRSLSGWIFGDVIGGDANKGSTAADQPNASNLEQWVFLDDNSFLNGKWTASYEAVKRANEVLFVCEGMDPADAAPYQAQARFVKGVQMFEAIKVFGAHVPYVTLEAYLEGNDPQVSNHQDGNLIYVWDLVAEDLKFAMDNLPDSWGKGNEGRVNKWAAAAVLAKLRLYQSCYGQQNKNGGADKWAEAKTLLDQIISSGKTSEGITLGLNPNYAQIFSINGDDTSENVFDVEYLIEGTAWQTCTINGSHAPAPQFITGAWGFYQPSYELTNCFIVDANGLPDFKSADHAPLCTKTPDGTAAKSDLTTAVDPRLDITAGRFAVPYYWDNVKEGWGTPAETALATYIRDVANAGLFFNKKYNPASTEAGAINDCPLASNKNLHVIRFAEVLLMRAEVAIHEGDYTTALNLINQIRNRAANSAWWLKNAANPHAGTANGASVGNDFAATYKVSAYPAGYMNASNAFAILQREIRLELGMEGNRWFDLCRWGTVKESLEAYGKNENKWLGASKYKDTYNANWYCLPLPLTQVQASDGRFIQNDVWK